MVQLRESVARFLSTRWKRFNSNMVQLRVYGREVLLYADLLFQFQYGSIKSIKSFVNEKYKYVFQFQYGSIKSKLLETK